MTDIVLATINARYIHSAFGLRCLQANLHELAPASVIVEFSPQDQVRDMVETILAHDPKVVGIGIYIWNVTASTELVGLLKALRPDLPIIIGGPEVSYETGDQAVCALADYVVCGEGEVTFHQLCTALLAGERPPQKICPGIMPDIATMALPYHLYTERDICDRVIYVEASRGCPYSCEFCLSSLDTKVRRFDLPRFLAAMDDLLARGVTQLKFIDRTFNLHISTSQAILQFFLDRLRPGLFLHFELVPDRLPAELKALIAQFPPGALQFEIGVQTLNKETEKLISRRQDQLKMRDNFAFLKEQTGVHIHADLIAGLPGESLADLSDNFDALLQLGPQEIQLGILKRLRGTPIVRHTVTHGMVYSPHSPYEVLRTAHISFTDMQRIKRFARYWDLVANSGRFVHTAPLIWLETAPFAAFMHFADWLYAAAHQTHNIALDRLAELLQTYLTLTLPLAQVRQALLADYERGPVRRLPAFLTPSVVRTKVPQGVAGRLPARQARHA